MRVFVCVFVCVCAYVCLGASYTHLGMAVMEQASQRATLAATKAFCASANRDNCGRYGWILHVRYCEACCAGENVKQM